MPIATFRAAEPLYIVILRNQQAENLLKSWIKEHRVEHASVAGNRMMLHHQGAFDRFMLTWHHNWDLVTVWDAWNRRHIYI